MLHVILATIVECVVVLLWARPRLGTSATSFDFVGLTLCVYSRKRY